MKYLFLLFFAPCILILSSAHAQTLRFKVIHSENFRGIDKVEIRSTFAPVIYTDAKGDFSLNYKDHDTLILTKDHYRMIFYVIEAKNFDPTHTISLTMTATGETANPNSTDIKTVQKFEYHFVHDQEPENNYIKIHAMEHTPSSISTKDTKQEFKIGSIPLNHAKVSKEQNSESSSDYNLK